MSKNKSQVPLAQSSRFSLPNHDNNDNNDKNSKIDKQFTFHSNNFQTQTNNEEAQNTVFKTIQNFQLNRKVYKLFTALKNHRGRHYAIDYRPQFGFSQYWEDNKKYKLDEYSNLEYFQYPHWVYYLFAFFILTSKLGIMWMVSVHRLFEMSCQGMGELMVWIMMTLILDVLLKYKLFTHYDYFKSKDLLKYFKSYWRDVLVLIYFSTYPAHFADNSHILLIVDYLVVALLSKRCKQLMTCLRLEITASSYKNVYDLAELFMMLLPIAHIFSLILYFVAQSNDQKNWLIAHELDILSPGDKYIYSLYFTLTTMLTVGYGDINPVTIPEIIVIMFVQIIGIATYGYIISSIGNIINYMRLQDQVLSRDISTISKMAKYYDIDKNLVEKAKNYLVFQKKQRATLTPQQEQSTLTKLHDDLKQQISKQNALKIVKSSLFYVCNWSKNFQLEIAKKLHKKIFTPNEEIIQTPGRERLYIFKKGKVEIHANRISGHKKHFKKILRTIEPNETMQVSDNIYGYTFLLSNTPVKLAAISKEFVVAYFVQKKNFLQTVMDCNSDVEYFFQMKTKIDTVTCPESWQAPLIINTKQHYFPCIQYLIMKEKQQVNKYKNIRSSKVNLRRYRNRTKRIYYRNFDDLEEGDYDPEVINNYLGQQSDPYVNRHKKVINSSKTQDNVFYSSSTFLSASFLNDSSVFKKENLHFLLQQGKQFINYFKKANRTEILSKFQKVHFVVNPQNLNINKQIQEEKTSTILLKRAKRSTKSTR